LIVKDKERMQSNAGRLDLLLQDPESLKRYEVEAPEETCRKLSDLGCRFVGVTLGSKGYIALADGHLIKKPAYPAETIDTTGCGDLFHAGVAFGIIQGWEAEKCLDLGAWAAASVSTQMGGRKGIPSLRELEERYLKRKTSTVIQKT